MFWFKRKKIIVDCFTNRSSVFEYSKLTPAKQNYPDWWKDLPKSGFFSNDEMVPNRNMKACAGFVQMYQTGYMISLWSDLRVKVGKMGTDSVEWQWSDQKSSAFIHAPKQSGDLYDSTLYQHLKLFSPWLLSAKQETNFLFHMPTWNMNNVFGNVIVLPGVVEYKYQNSTNVQILIKRETEEKIINLPFGMPIVQLTPLTENEVVFKHHLIGDEEFNNINSSKEESITFGAKYYVKKKLLKSKESKCPFGFGNK